MMPNRAAVPDRQYHGKMTLALFALTAAVSSVGCEDKAIGRTCELSVNGGSSNQALYNPQALECPSRLCLRPAVHDSLTATVDTTSLCSAECSKDSDCSTDQNRGKNSPPDAGQASPPDRRCMSGFTCGVTFEVGPLCCKKLCMCKDFLKIPAGGLMPPVSCTKPGPNAACDNIKTQ